MKKYIRQELWQIYVDNVRGEIPSGDGVQAIGTDPGPIPEDYTYEHLLKLADVDVAEPSIPCPFKVGDQLRPKGNNSDPSILTVVKIDEEGCHYNSEPRPFIPRWGWSFVGGGVIYPEGYEYFELVPGKSKVKKIVWKDLTDYEKNAVFAEQVAGFTDIHQSEPYQISDWPDRIVTIGRRTDMGGELDRVPDYLHSLDALYPYLTNQHSQWHLMQGFNMANRYHENVMCTVWKVRGTGDGYAGEADNPHEAIMIALLRDQGISVVT
jgi:hypothetical protein